MRKTLLIVPILVALGCNHEKNDVSQPTAGSPERPPAAMPVPTTTAPTAQAACADDSGCGVQQLCIRASCVSIGEGLAECGSARVHFDSDSAELRPDDKKALDRVARCLMGDQALRIVIEGNADDRGTPEHNLQLGDRRATAVALYLGSLGVPDRQLRTVSYGEDNPLCVDKDEGCYAKNRRASIKAKGGTKAASRRPSSM